MTKSTNRVEAESLDLSELDRVTAAGELSDRDLDQVVGGKDPNGGFDRGRGRGRGRGTGGGFGRGDGSGGGRF
jgi:hypothetical protein